MSGGERFELGLTLRDGYTFTVDFAPGEGRPLVVDELPPLGEANGPNPARLLAAAVGSCLSASLLFCLRKSRVEVTELRTTVEGTIVRNERGRLRSAACASASHPKSRRNSATAWDAAWTSFRTSASSPRASALESRWMWKWRPRWCPCPLGKTQQMRGS